MLKLLAAGHRLCRASLLLIACMLPGHGLAQLNDKALTEMLRSSGVETAIQQVEFAYQLNLQRQKAEYALSEQQNKRLDEAIAGYRSTALLNELRDYLRSELNAESAAAVLQVLQTDVMQRFRRFERITQLSQQQEKFQNYQPKTPLSKERLELLRACHLADFGPSLSAVIQSFAEVDTAVALDHVSGDMFSRNDAEGVKLWRARVEEIYTERYVEQADPYLSFTYRFIRDEQLLEYASLWQDENLTEFMQKSLQGLRLILRQRRQPMLSNLADLQAKERER